MSNALAIATVTATLSGLVEEAAKAAVSGAVANNKRPDSVTGNELNDSFVNVFLYQVSPNAALRNRDVPTRTKDGELVRRPTVALDLNYLLSFYGDDTNLIPQRMMGSVLRALHTEPILGKQLIRDTIAATSVLAGSDLADEVESVRLTNMGLSLEDIFKLWSAFHQSPYILSTAFQASVVLIEAAVSTRTALPVRSRNAIVNPFRYPEIEQVDPQVLIYVPNVRVTLRGRNLDADAVTVRFGELEGAVLPPVTASAVTVQLPSTISAGVKTVRINHDLMIGTPPVRHRGVESNTAPFILQPRLVARSFTALPARTISATLDPPVDTGQQVDLLLNESTPPPDVPPRTFTIRAPGRSTAAFSLTFDAAAVPASTYMVRVRVDGADSALDVETDNTKPTYNQYVGPTVVVTP